MTDSWKLLLELFVMFSGGKLLAEACQRLRQPAVLGELVAGVLLGPSVLALIHPNEMIEGLAEIVSILLLFTVGLETRPSALLEVGGAAILVAVLGVITPFVLGFLYMKLSTHELAESIFVGAAMVATSVGITARVLADSGVMKTRVARVIMAAAVLDDILGLIVLAVVSSLSSGRFDYLQLGIVRAEAFGFTALTVYLGPRMVRGVRPAVAKLRTRNPAFILSVILCVGLSLASVYIGMAAIIGAFLAGLAMAEHSEDWSLHENARPVMEFMTPFFFVLLGAQMNLKAAALPGVILTAAVVCLLAIVSKLIGCGLGSLHLGWKTSLQIGIGMVPRGEVGLIVAAVGLGLHTVSNAIYSVVLLMSIVTTLFAPPMLRLILGSHYPDADPANQ